MAATVGSRERRQSIPHLNGLMQLAQKLLERSADELQHIDRPVARFAAERCLCQLIIAAEHLAKSRDGRRCAELRRAASCLAAAQHALEVVHRFGAIIPSGYDSLQSGFRVLSRQIARSLDHLKSRD